MTGRLYGEGRYGSGTYGGSTDDSGDCDPPGSCGPDCIAWNDIHWGMPGDLTNFEKYDVQRRDPITDWQPIAEVVDASITSFRDLECRIGMSSCYRVRVANRSGLISDWTDALCDVAPSTGPGYTLTSNWAPADSVAYPDVYEDGLPRRAFEFVEAAEVSERIFHQRNFSVAFRPREYRGVRFSRNLLVSAHQTPPPGELPALGLLTLTRAPLPYICVRDEAGGRWFSSVTVPSMDDITLFQTEIATINVLEVTQTAAVVLVGEVA